MAERQSGLESVAHLTTEEELLFFTLFSLKSGLTYDWLGFVCEMDAANAKRNQVLGLKVLKQEILSVSHCWMGRTRDYRMFKEECPPKQAWFKDLTVPVDLGFLGIEKDYVCQQVLLPPKKKKSRALSFEQKNENL